MHMNLRNYYLWFGRKNVPFSAMTFCHRIGTFYLPLLRLPLLSPEHLGYVSCSKSASHAHKLCVCIYSFGKWKYSTIGHMACGRRNTKRNAITPSIYTNIMNINNQQSRWLLLLFTWINFKCLLHLNWAQYANHGFIVFTLCELWATSCALCVCQLRVYNIQFDFYLFIFFLFLFSFGLFAILSISLIAFVHAHDEFHMFI